MAGRAPVGDIVPKRIFYLDLRVGDLCVIYDYLFLDEHDHFLNTYAEIEMPLIFMGSIFVEDDLRYYFLSTKGMGWRHDDDRIASRLSTRLYLISRII